MAGLISTVVQAEPPDVRSQLALARAGDAEAYNQVYRAYATRLLRQALALCGNAALAEELAQDTLVEAWKYLGRYNGRCEFFTWLCAILLNRYRNTLRSNRCLSFSPSAPGDQEDFTTAIEKVIDVVPLPDRAAELREQSALVRRCIADLPFKQQQVIFLRFYVDHSLEGIAAALGCSVGTVKSRLFNALEKLRRMNALVALFPNPKHKE